MNYIRIFRTVAVALTLALLAAAVPAVPALAISEVYVHPSSGRVGTAVTITGTDFPPNGTVEICFPDKMAHILYAATDLAGYFTSANFSIGTYPAGSQTVYVRDVTSGNWSWGTFTITPRISLNQLSGYVGDSIKVSGDGFTDSSSATIYFDDERCGATTTNGAGTFTNATFTVPISYQGSHTI